MKHELPSQCTLTTLSGHRRITVAKSKHNIGEEALGLLGEEMDYARKKLPNLTRNVCKGLKLLIKGAGAEHKVRKGKLCQYGSTVL